MPPFLGSTILSNYSLLYGCVRNWFYLRIFSGDSCINRAISASKYELLAVNFPDFRDLQQLTFYWPDADEIYHFPVTPLLWAHWRSQWHNRPIILFFIIYFYRILCGVHTSFFQRLLNIYSLSLFCKLPTNYKLFSLYQFSWLWVIFRQGCGSNQPNRTWSSTLLLAFYTWTIRLLESPTQIQNRKINS
jgi:hypothetical protein